MLLFVFEWDPAEWVELQYYPDASASVRHVPQGSMLHAFGDLTSRLYCFSAVAYGKLCIL